MLSSCLLWINSLSCLIIIKLLYVRPAWWALASLAARCRVCYLMTLTLIQPVSNWTHWATLRCHPCLSRAATYLLPSRWTLSFVGLCWLCSSSSLLVDLVLSCILVVVPANTVLAVVCAGGTYEKHVQVSEVVFISICGPWFAVQFWFWPLRLSFHKMSILLCHLWCAASRLFSRSRYWYSVASVVCRRLLSVTWCIVAKRCVLQQKLLLRAYRKSYEKSIGTTMNDLDLCLEVVSRSCQPLRYIRRWISLKPLQIQALFQRTTNRKWRMGYQMVTWPMTLHDPKGAVMQYGRLS